MREAPIGAEYFALYSDFTYDFNFGDPSSQNYSGNYRLSSDTTSFDLEEGAFIRGQYVILKHNSILFYDTLRSEERNGFCWNDWWWSNIWRRRSRSRTSPVGYRLYVHPVMFIL